MTKLWYKKYWQIKRDFLNNCSKSTILFNKTQKNNSQDRRSIKTTIVCTLSPCYFVRLKF